MEELVNKHYTALQTATQQNPAQIGFYLSSDTLGFNSQTDPKVKRTFYNITNSSTGKH